MLIDVRNEIPGHLGNQIFRNQNFSKFSFIDNNSHNFIFVTITSVIISISILLSLLDYQVYLDTSTGYEPKTLHELFHQVRIFSVLLFRKYI